MERGSKGFHKVLIIRNLYQPQVAYEGNYRPKRNWNGVPLSQIRLNKTLLLGEHGQVVHLGEVSQQLHAS